MTQTGVRFQESKNTAASRNIYSPSVYRDFLQGLVGHKEMPQDTYTLLRSVTPQDVHVLQWCTCTVLVVRLTNVTDVRTVLFLTPWPGTCHVDSMHREGNTKDWVQAPVRQ